MSKELKIKKPLTKDYQQIYIDDEPTGIQINSEANIVIDKLVINDRIVRGASDATEVVIDGGLVLNHNDSNYFKATVGSDGETAITTVDDGAFNTSGDMTITPDGDLTMGAGTGSNEFRGTTLTLDAGSVVKLDSAGSAGASGTRFLYSDTMYADIGYNSNGGKLRLYDSADTDNYFHITTIDNGATTVKTHDQSGSDGNFALDADGSITLNSTTGVFIAENNGTEYSAANSAYAGMILGYTDIGLNEARQTYTLTTSFVVPTDEFSVSFKAPPSGNVEIMISVCFNAGSAGVGDLYAGLSTANATSGYAQLADFHEEELLDQSGRYGRDIVQNYWTLTGLTPGTAYEYWVGFKSTVAHASIVIEYGGSDSGHNPDFIMKATALPATITT